MNANWTAATKDQQAFFELMVVTEDELRHSLQVPSDQMAALVALTQASSVLLWDSANQTLIASNLVGEWLPQTLSLLEGR